MKRLLALPVLALPLIAASPPGSGLNLGVQPVSPENSLPPQFRTLPPPSYQPAPLPNRDVELPGTAASAGTSVAPSLFTRNDTYRGEGFAKGSTAQAEQDKRVRPGAGFSLKMPFTPN